MSAPTRAARVRNGRGARTVQRAFPCYLIMTGKSWPGDAEGYWGGSIDALELYPAGSTERTDLPFSMPWLKPSRAVRL